MAGLARVIPDATRHLDDLVGRLQPYREPATVFCVVSDHGERAVTSRINAFEISPEKISKSPA